MNKYHQSLDFDNLPAGVQVLNESFVFVPTKLETHYVDFQVYERLARNTYQHGIKLPDRVDIYLTGSIKWDGCSHLWFLSQDNKADEPEYDSYRHICGLGHWQNTVEMYELLYKHAMSLLTSADKSEIWKDQS